jgi:hypothetical protein
MTETEILEDTRELIRTRRALEQSLQNALEDYNAHRGTLDGLKEKFKDPANHAAECEFASYRNELNKLAAAWSAAKQRLDEFARLHPTKEELEREERRMVHAQTREEQREVRQKFAEILRQQVECISKLESLQQQASTAWEEAIAKWPLTQRGSERNGFMPVGVFYEPGLFGAAALTQDAASLFPEGFYGS